MSQDALGQLKHLKTARARWPFPDVDYEGKELGSKTDKWCRNNYKNGSVFGYSKSVKSTTS